MNGREEQVVEVSGWVRGEVAAGGVETGVGCGFRAREVGKRSASS